MLRLPRHPAAPPRYAALYDPGTALMVAAGVGALGTVVQSLGALQQGQATQQAENYNAELAEQQAVTVQQTAAQQAEQEQYEVHQTTGQQVANAGQSGVDPNQGSPLSVISDTATQGQLEAQTLLWQGKSQAIALQNQGQQDLYAGQQAAAAAPVNAFGTFLTGIGKTSLQLAPTFGSWFSSSGSDTKPSTVPDYS